MTLWKETDDWTYEYFDLDTPAAEFQKFESIVDLWNSKRQGVLLPKRSDFDFYDFKGWLGKINLTTVSYDPFSYTYILFGTHSVDIFGAEHTGKTGAEVDATHGFPEEDTIFYEMTCTHKKISLVSGSFTHEGLGRSKAVFLELPLSEDGETVTHTIEIAL